MGCPEIEMNEGSRQMSAKASGVLNIICVVPSLIILSVGAYIQTAIQQQIGLIEGFNGDILPAFMIVFGFFGSVVGLLSGKACWSNRDCSKRLDWSKYLLPLVVVQLILASVVFVSAIMCFVQISMLETSFEKGISSAMLDYKNDRMKKRELDTLQISYKCCGVTSYTDWFHVSWIHEEYIPEAKKELLSRNKAGDYLNDDVPFSCCVANVLRPCVHHHVHDNDMHYNYDYRAQVTLHGTGCKDALMEIYGNRLLTEVGALVLSISFLQMITVLVMRLLQTSVDGSLENDDPMETSIGYIFPCSGKGAIKAVKREVKTFHKMDRTQKKGDPTSMEPLLENEEDNASIDTDDISLNSSFEDEGVYEENLLLEEEENPYMTINSAEMLNFPVPPRYTSFPGKQVPDTAHSGHIINGQHGIQNHVRSKDSATPHMIGTDQYRMASQHMVGTDQHRMASQHMVGIDRHGKASQHMVGIDRHGMASQHMVGTDQHGMASQHMVGTDQHGMASQHMVGTDQHGMASQHKVGTDQHGMASQHMVGTDQHGMASQHKVGTDQHGMASQHMVGNDQHRMANQHMVGAEAHRASDTYLTPRRTHTYVNELPQHGTTTQM
ncbi:peripherin-2-like [Ylistrum balloti]|uniref:peripherin-2-like n=1 Tax=Ylistrum balloti TaxID=509963 RepID=UPI002905B10D|nr:peripherin-2-like [Ylistrum balloti]